MQRLYERVALSICAIALTVVAASSLSARVGAATHDERFDELTVRRLRVVDASGATRLLLSGKPVPPGTIDGKHLPSERSGFDGAGLMFYNDQGDEQGGLTYSGRNGQQGEALTFDAWHQDQALEIQHRDDANGSDSYVAGSELRKTSLYDDLVPYQREIAAAHTDAERQAIRSRYRSEGKFGRRRFLVGNRGGVSELALHDANGRVRLHLSVTAAGEARVEFLDARGVVMKSITP